MAPRLLLVVLALALAVAGCGGDDDGGDSEPAASPFERNPCELLGEDDVEAILGQAVEGRSTEGDPATGTPGQCQWSTGEPASLAEPEPTPTGITLFLGDERIFDNTRVLAEQGREFGELEDLGDAAYASTGQGGVRFGEAGIAVSPIGVNLNNEGSRDVVVDILRRVAENY